MIKNNMIKNKKGVFLLNNEKLNTIEATFLVVIVTLSHIILNLPNTIIKSVGSSAIINVIYVSILTLVFFLILNKLFEPFPGKDIIDVSEYVGGKVLKYITNFIYTFYLIFVSGTLILNFSEILKLIYFQNAFTPLIILIFIISAVIANKIGFKNIVKANTLIVFVILATVVVIFCASLDNVEFQRIFPILGFGAKETFLTGTLNIFSFGGLLYLYLIRPNLKEQKKYKSIGIISIILSAMYLLLSVASLLLLFPFLLKGTETLSVYMSTRTIDFGNFFERTDALFILVWIFTFLSYLSVIISYITRINKKTLNVKNSSPIIYIIGILIFIVSMIPKDAYQIKFLEENVYKYLSISVVFVYSFLIILIGYIKKLKEKAQSNQINKGVKNES